MRHSNPTQPLRPRAHASRHRRRFIPPIPILPQRPISRSLTMRNAAPSSPVSMNRGAVAHCSSSRARGRARPITLAHRVAHLLVKGADPHRILLLTFSRRAALEMTRRVTRIAINALSSKSAIAHGLTWSGTFSIASAVTTARLRRSRRSRAVVHHQRLRRLRRSDEPRASRTRPVVEEKALSRKVHVLRDLYSRVVNTGASLATVLDQPFRGAASGKPISSACLPLTSTPSRRTSSITTICCSLLVASRRRAEYCGRLVEPLRPRAHREYQDTNRLRATILLAMKPDGRGLTVVGDGRCTVHLFVPRCDGAQYPRFSAAFLTELTLDPPMRPATNPACRCSTRII